MNTILKYSLSIALAVALIGCQNDSSEESAPQQSPQQSQQQSDQLGQMQQQSAPEVDLSDEEAQTFADAAMSAQEVQMGAQKEMVQIIKDEGLDVETYQQIAKSQQQQMGQGQQGQSSPPSDVSESDMEKYQNAQESLKEAQADIQDKVASAVEDEGMEMQRFQEISKAAQQDTQLQKQIRQKMQEKMGSQGGMQQQQPPTGN